MTLLNHWHPFPWSHAGLLAAALVLASAMAGPLNEPSARADGAGDVDLAFASVSHAERDKPDGRAGYSRAGHDRRPEPNDTPCTSYEYPYWEYRLGFCFRYGRRHYEIYPE
jgi:hypothetical protein